MSRGCFEPTLRRFDSISNSTRFPPYLTKVCMCVEVNTWRLEIASELHQLWEAGGGEASNTAQMRWMERENGGNFFERMYCLTFDGEKLCRCTNRVDAKNIFFF